MNGLSVSASQSHGGVGLDTGQRTRNTRECQQNRILRLGGLGGDCHGSYSDSVESQGPLLGFELLLFRRFHHEPLLWYEWRDRLWQKAVQSSSNIQTEVSCKVTTEDKKSGLQTLETLEDLGLVDIQQDLWYLSVMLHKRPQQLLEMVKREMERENKKIFPKLGETLMMRYFNLFNFTVLTLDSIFKFGDDNRLPREIFQCRNVRQLSLKYNSLEHLPCDIGRMSSLEYLALTNNKLSVWSLPYSLTFLKHLSTLMLDNNLLDALPGFLPDVISLKTVHRHGNHNYFKSTFMWYHTDVTLRIIPVVCEAHAYDKDESLQFWSAKSVIGSKQNFYVNPDIAPDIRDYISDIYNLFNICHHCNRACLLNKNGFKVITFKNPYLGNTCVPFQHWACSLECAKAVEIPARREQISAAQKLDQQYEDYINECVRKFSSHRSPRSLLTCATRDRERDRRQSKRDKASNSNSKVKSRDRHRRGGRSRRGLSDSSLSKCGCVIS